MSVVDNMNSTTGDFSEIRKSTLSDEIYNRGTHSSVKRKPRKLINLRPLNLNGIKKEIEEGVEEDEKQPIPIKIGGQENLEMLITETDSKLQQVAEDILADITNQPHSESGRALCEKSDKYLIQEPKNTLGILPQQQKNDSFDLDFSALSLSTPVKQDDKNVNQISSIAKSEQLRELFITPKVNNIVLKNQFSLSKKTFLKTPINSLNKISAKQLITPYKSVTLQKMLPTVLENQYTPKNDEKGNSNTFPNYPKDNIATPSHKIPMNSIDGRLVNINEHSQYFNPVDTLKDDTFKRITVNNIEYIMFSLLGKGGSSEVYQCYNLESKIHVAIKCVSLQNPASANGYINEVKLLQQLQSCDKIIKMYDYEILASQGKLLVVLENGGKDLSAILKQLACQKSHIPMYMLLFYWMEMLYAVKQIHSNGIIHSDLKPANFLKVDEGLKLIDFGIASTVQTDMTSVIKTKQEGSCNYISPEALNSDSANFGNMKNEKYKIHYKSDVWSLGCILYQFVYRRTPFQHITQLWPKLAAIMNPEHVIGYPDAEWVSPKIIGTIKKCLQYNVKLRPSVDELIAEYDTILLNI